jgi:hypothetical protein
MTKSDRSCHTCRFGDDPVEACEASGCFADPASPGWEPAPCGCPLGGCKGVTQDTMPANCRLLQGDPAQLDAMTTVATASLTSRPSLPDDASARNSYPMADGLLDYFPNALAEVSRLSHFATQQHHPDQPMHWARGKSADHRNKIMRHLVDTGKLDDKGMRHSAMVAWRALALLQEELEAAEGLPMSRGSRPARP